MVFKPGGSREFSGGFLDLISLQQLFLIHCLCLAPFRPAFYLCEVTDLYRNANIACFIERYGVVSVKVFSLIP